MHASGGILVLEVSLFCSPLLLISTQHLEASYLVFFACIGAQVIGWWWIAHHCFPSTWAAWVWISLALKPHSNRQHSCSERPPESLNSPCFWTSCRSWYSHCLIVHGCFKYLGKLNVTKDSVAYTRLNIFAGVSNVCTTNDIIATTGLVTGDGSGNIPQVEEVDVLPSQLNWLVR